MTALSANTPATAANQVVGNQLFAAATSAVLVATVADTLPHVLGPFNPQLNRAIWLTLNATLAASGQAQILRSTDGGATKLAMTRQSVPIGQFAFAGLAGVIVNEKIDVETDAAAEWFLSIQLTAGSVSVRMAQ